MRTSCELFFEIDADPQVFIILNRLFVICIAITIYEFITKTNKIGTSLFCIDGFKFCLYKYYQKKIVCSFIALKNNLIIVIGIHD